MGGGGENEVFGFKLNIKRTVYICKYKQACNKFVDIRVTELVA